MPKQPSDVKDISNGYGKKSLSKAPDVPTTNRGITRPAANIVSKEHNTDSNIPVKSKTAGINDEKMGKRNGKGEDTLQAAARTKLRSNRA